MRRQQRLFAVLTTDRQAVGAAFVPAGFVDLEGHVSDLPLPAKQVQAHELGDLGEVVPSAGESLAGVACRAAGYVIGQPNALRNAKPTHRPLRNRYRHD